MQNAVTACTTVYDCPVTRLLQKGQVKEQRMSYELLHTLYQYSYLIVVLTLNFVYSVIYELGLAYSRL